MGLILIQTTAVPKGRNTGFLSYLSGEGESVSRALGCGVAITVEQFDTVGIPAARAGGDSWVFVGLPASSPTLSSLPL